MGSNSCFRNIRILESAPETLISSQVTTGGLYNFTGLNPGDYRIEVNKDTLPSSWVLTSGSESGTIELEASETITNADLGFFLPAPEGLLNFNDLGVISYAPQDVHSTSFEILDDGATLRLFGNTWKIIPFEYDVTVNTVVQFDFKSDGTEPEVAGITLDEDTAPSTTDFWKVYGTQKAGNPNI